MVPTSYLSDPNSVTMTKPAGSHGRSLVSNQLGRPDTAASCSSQVASTSQIRSTLGALLYPTPDPWLTTVDRWFLKQSVLFLTWNNARSLDTKKGLRLVTPFF